jgi:hypothetical protein
VIALWNRFWSGVRRGIGLILPFFARAKDFRGLGPKFRTVLRVLVLLVILAILYWMNWRFELGRGLGRAPTFSLGPNLIVKLADFWLPILFLLLVAMSWIGWWLWSLTQEEEISAFPDIDEAWEEAMTALHRAGIDVTDPPLFLVFGRSPGSEGPLFDATHFPLLVKQVPPRMNAPIHAYGSRDCMFITCPDASLLGRHAAILAGEAEGVTPGSPLSTADGGFDPNKTLIPHGHALDVQSVLARAREQGRDPQHLTEEENQEIKTILSAAAAEEAQRQGKARQRLLKNNPEVERLTARLKHLCKLVVRDRHPYCPVNGLMVVVPVAATDTDEDANQTGTLIQKDLSAAREVLQVYCPIVTLVGDLESVPGFAEFIQRFPEAQRQRRVGQRFPYLPDLEPPAIEAKLEEAGHWICHALVPSWVYRLFRVERPGSDSLQNAVQGNVHLYQFLSQMRARQKRLSRTLSRGFAGDGTAPPMFGGCYIGGTGRNSKDQAFVEGVFQRLLQDQSFVSWTRQAVAGEASYYRWARIGYVSLIVFVALLATGIFFFIRKQT